MDKKEIKYSIIGLLILFAIVVAVLFLVYKEKKPELNNYQIEDIKEDEVVFVYRYIRYGETNFVWIFNKDGKRKKIDLNRHWYSDVYSSDKATFLANLDKCMANDEELPFQEPDLELTKEQINYCINLVDMKLVTDKMFDTGSGGSYIYVVSGTGENRQLKLMELRSNKDSISADETIKYVSEIIYDSCYWRR